MPSSCLEAAFRGCPETNSSAGRRYRARSRTIPGWSRCARWTDFPLHEAGVYSRSFSFPPPVQTGSGSTGPSQPLEGGAHRGCAFLAFQRLGLRIFRALSKHTTSAPSRSLLKCFIERCENSLSFKAGAIDLANNDHLELICVGAERSQQMK